jgi:hypothetical protein
MMILLLLIYITLVTYIHGSRNVLVMTIIEDGSEKVLLSSVENALSFVNSLDGKCGDKIDCIMYFRQEVKTISSTVVTNKIVLANIKVEYSDRNTIPDHSNLGTPEPYQERVSQILYAVNHTCNLPQYASNSNILFVSFHAQSHPVPSSTFSHIFDKISSTTSGVMLLEKTKRLNSVSDWHDLMVLGIVPGSKGALEFVRVLITVYMHHADRPVFPLFSPRGAIMEATRRNSKLMTVDYFSRKEVCVKEWTKNSHGKSPLVKDFHGHGEHTSFCRGKETPLEISCGDGSDYLSHICSTIHIPHGWMNSINHLDLNSLSGKFMTNPKQLVEGMCGRQAHGTMRYRLTKHEDMLADFCWDVG